MGYRVYPTFPVRCGRSYYGVMANRIKDYFPTSNPPNLTIKNIEAPAASTSRPDPIDLPAALDPVVDLLAGKRIAVLTGAGLSTDSGLPDYRSPGSAPRQPITIQQFMSEERWRRHYWARNHLGWRGPEHAQPNEGHTALALLESLDVVTGVITQNVDRLHSRAGSANVVDLHGRFDQVICTECADRTSREHLHERLDALNPGWTLRNVPKMEIAPDADATVTDTSEFQVADCERCGGILRTDVVFFGGKVSNDVVAQACDYVTRAEALLVAGSTLAVGSAMRFVRQACAARLPIVIVNRGETRADSRADIKVHAGTSQTLAYLAQEL